MEKRLNNVQNYSETVICFRGDEILVEHTPEGDAFPCQPRDVELLPMGLYAMPYTVQPLPMMELFPFLADGHPVARWNEGEPVPEGMEFVPLRPLFKTLSPNDFRAATKAKEFVFWNEHSRYCPVCGSVPIWQNGRYPWKKCPKCANEMFTTIAPAVIVRITRGDEILLVRAHNFRGKNYGLVAGFLEAGETFEECVEREVMEEVGLTIKNLTYFGNQAWPFPSGQMVGFTAEYAGGEIKLQTEELADARFFNKSELPDLPDSMSIARRLIDDFLGQA